MLARSAVLAILAVAGTAWLGGTPAAAQAIDCKMPFYNNTAIYAPAAKAPAVQPLKRKLKRDAPVAWSKAVAAKCPGADPSWVRAKKRTIRCGHFSSQPRFTCGATATPAQRRR